MSEEFITNYRFGEIQINSKNYTDDIILLGKKVIPNWWRDRGHSLNKSDLKKVIDYNPDLLIVGTGNTGNMNVPQKLIQDLNFKVQYFKTEEAVKKYNKILNEAKKVAGAFHLTC
jgi:hypothetical protein